MALVAVAMTHGNGLRCTDSLGNCMSYGYSIGASGALFTGPIASFMFRFQYYNAGDNMCSVGFADAFGSIRRRIWVEVSRVSSNFVVRLKIDSTACGAVTVDTYTFAGDTSEHSVCATYNQAGNYKIWVDKVAVKMGVSPCSDISAPADSSDTFAVYCQHSTAENFRLDEVYYTNQSMGQAEVTDFHDNGVS